MTTALYRRYRPETFADVIGQEHVTEPLSQALRTGRVNHAYLFSGPRGCGKTTSARILARCLNCEEGPTPTPCGVCGSCVALARGGSGSVDVIEIDAASHGGVDDARDLRERASYGPASSRYKIYIIDEAHMVTPQGFNALLKIVEEPPEHVKFVFATTEPDKVIGTIRSRTHHYPFHLVPPQRLQDYLAELAEAEHVAIAPGVLSFVVRAGAGSVRDSLSVLDQLISGSGPEGVTYEGTAALLGFTDAELLDATIDSLAARDGAAVFRQVDKVIESGHDPRRFVEDLLERFRDLIVVAAVPDGGSSVLRGLPADQLDRMRQQAAAFGPGAMSRAADIVNAGLTEMTGATAPRLQLELICARVLLPGASGESGYAARLDRLERRLEMGASPPAPRVTSAPATSSASSASSAPRPEAAPFALSASSPGAARATGPGPSEAVNGSLGEAASARPASSAPGVEAVAVSAEPDSPLPAAAAPPSPPSPTSPTSAPPAAAVMDTEALRRAWPDILAKIYEIKRLTWTFLSAHAQVIDYDGSRLLLGIETVGLHSTFQRGQHAELVRQAIVEVLGLDVVVEGVTSADAAGRANSTGAATASGRPSTGRSRDQRPAAAPSREPVNPRSWGSTTNGGRPGVDNGGGAGLTSDASPSSEGWSSSAAPPPDWATPATEGDPVESAGTAPTQREAATRRASAERAAAAKAPDDSLVSRDDESVEMALRAGPDVISSVLGGTVIGELEQ